MYTLSTDPQGFRITIGDRVSVEEARAVLAQARAVLPTAPKPFGVLVDLRTLRPLLPEVQELVNQTQKQFAQHGLRRSCIVVASTVVALQFKRIAAETGVKAHERVVDASVDPHWERSARAWIDEGVEPAA